MQITKEALQNIVNHLPENAEVQTVIDKILLTAKLDKAFEELKEGNGISEKELEKEMDEWFKENYG
jgi:hypothetical protein